MDDVIHVVPPLRRYELTRERPWRQPRVGDASAELDIHVVGRREHLATETTEVKRERDTPVPALCSIHAQQSLHVYRLVVFLVHGNNQ